MHYKYIIRKRLLDVSGYPYYVQRLHSLDGKTYCYCGYGKDGKTIEDCERWIKEDSAEIVSELENLIYIISQKERHDRNW